MTVVEQLWFSFEFYVLGYFDVVFEILIRIACVYF